MEYAVLWIHKSHGEKSIVWPLSKNDNDKDVSKWWFVLLSLWKTFFFFFLSSVIYKVMEMLGNNQA